MAEGTEESRSAPSFTPLQVLREMILVFQHQFGGAFQKFPSLSDPQGGAPSVPQPSRVCEVHLEWLEVVCRKPRHPQIQRSHGTSKPFFIPLPHYAAAGSLVALHVSGFLSEVISLHSGERKIIKGWAWRLPAPCGCAGGLSVPAGPTVSL